MDSKAGSKFLFCRASHWKTGSHFFGRTLALARDKEDKQSRACDNGQKDAAQEIQSEAPLAGADKGTVGVEVEGGVAPACAGRAFQANTAVVEFLKVCPTGAGLFSQHSLKPKGGAELPADVAQDFEFPAFSQVLRALGGHLFFFLLLRSYRSSSGHSSSHSPPP